MDLASNGVFAISYFEVLLLTVLPKYPIQSGGLSQSKYFLRPLYSMFVSIGGFRTESSQYIKTEKLNHSSSVVDFC